MSVVTAEDIISVEEFSAYRDRVIKAREEFILRGRGSRNACSFDIRIHASRIRGILTAKQYDLPLLEKVEEWLEKNPPIDLIIADTEEDLKLISAN